MAEQIINCKIASLNQILAIDNSIGDSEKQYHQCPLSSKDCWFLNDSSMPPSEY
jgi:hypothetical protein